MDEREINGEKQPELVLKLLESGEYASKGKVYIKSASFSL